MSAAGSGASGLMEIKARGGVSPKTESKELGT